MNPHLAVRTETDVVSFWLPQFLKDVTVPCPTSWIWATDLHARACDWAGTRGHIHPSVTAFGRALNRLPVNKGRNSKVYYRGLRMKETARGKVENMNPEEKTTDVSDNAKSAMRLFVRVMEDEAYEVTKKRYKPGYSDARMSKDLGLSEKHIASLRDHYFGPAGEPDEVTALRIEIDRLTSELGQVRGKFDQMCNRNGFRR